jgi:hypothetical protein
MDRGGYLEEVGPRKRGSHGGRDPYPAAPSTLAIQSALWMASIAAPVPFSHARAFSCCAHACSA